MKFIHIADVHLGSAMKRFSALNAGERNGEIVSAFLRVLDYAKERDIKTVVIAGDLFDSNAPFSVDKDVLYSAVKRNPDINFLYLRGNHDDVLEMSLPNLLLFNNPPTSYEIGDLTFTGVEIDDSNYTTFYDSLDLDANKKNVLILHGEASSEAAKDKIALSKLKDKGVDYLALGHIHSFYEGRIDDRGVYVNPGCLEGRGFDECGEKGFVVVDGENFKWKFVKNSYRVVREVEVDLTETKDVYEAIALVKSSVSASKRDVLRITLKGGLTYATDVKPLVYEQCKNDYYYVEVKNETYQAVNVDDLLTDLSLKGEFVRETTKSTDVTDEERKKILAIGLNLLEKRTI